MHSRLFHYEVTMPGISLSGITSTLIEPAPAFKFEVVLPQIYTARNTLLEPISTIFAQRVSVGGRSLTSEEMFWAGWQKSFGQGSVSEDVTITFVEKFDYSVYNYFDSWMDLIHSDDGKFGLPGGDKGYWKDLYVYGLDTTGRRKAKFRVVEAYPLNRAPNDYDGTATNHLMPSITFKNFQTKFTQIDES